MVHSRVQHIYRWTQLIRESLTISEMKRCKNIKDYKQKWAVMTPMFIAALFTKAKT